MIIIVLILIRQRNLSATRA